MRGASALGKLLAAHREADVRVMVIWLPVLDSDKGPPKDDVRRPLRDPRVTEYWDPERWASPRMLERASLLMRARGEEPHFGPDAVAWDVIALFPAGVVWEDPFPAPTWWDAPVEDALEPVAKVLAGAR